jgi:hypothetical protein
MRMAQARARSERFDLKLPPLESMHAVQSALTQILEAVAADMLDLKRADRLIRVLTVASRNLLKADKWPAAQVFHSDHAADVDVAAEYDLPHDLDVDTPPEVAFPQNVILSGGGAPSAPPQSKDPYPANDPPRVTWPAAAAGLRDLLPHPVTPEYVELEEIRQTQGSEAASARSAQMLRNERRRTFHSERKRYADIAMNMNLRRAADTLAERKLAQQAQASDSPAPQTKELTLSEEFDALNAREAAARQAASGKKPVASVAAGPQTGAKAALTPTGSHG